MSKDSYREYKYYLQKNISGQAKDNNLITMMNKKLIKYLYYVIEPHLTHHNLNVKCD